MKNVLITGGNKGIGLEITRYFLTRHHRIFCIARDFSAFEFAHHNNIHCMPFDLHDVEKIPQLIASLPPIDILINNSGTSISLQYDSYSQEQIDYILRLNIQAPVALINAVSNTMIINKSGRIINNASLAGHIGHPDIWYGITKAGLINATKSFAKILGPHGIIINAIAAGPVDANDPDEIPGSHRDLFKQSIITRRFCTPVEVAETVGWLALEAPEYINGTCIDMNNGVFMR